MTQCQESQVGQWMPFEKKEIGLGVEFRGGGEFPLFCVLCKVRHCLRWLLAVWSGGRLAGDERRGERARRLGGQQSQSAPTHPTFSSWELRCRSRAAYHVIILLSHPTLRSRYVCFAQIQELACRCIRVQYNNPITDARPIKPDQRTYSAGQQRYLSTQNR